MNVCLRLVDSTDNDANKKHGDSYNKSLVAASLTLITSFWTLMKETYTKPHEYLIEQLQFTGDESIGSSSNKVK